MVIAMANPEKRESLPGPRLLGMEGVQSEDWLYTEFLIGQVSKLKIGSKVPQCRKDIYNRSRKVKTFNYKREGHDKKSRCVYRSIVRTCVTDNNCASAVLSYQRA